jgi:hypothetical protein
MIVFRVAALLFALIFADTARADFATGQAAYERKAPVMALSNPRE